MKKKLKTSNSDETKSSIDIQINYFKLHLIFTEAKTFYT